MSIFQLNYTNGNEKEKCIYIFTLQMQWLIMASVIYLIFIFFIAIKKMFSFFHFYVQYILYICM